MPVLFGVGVNQWFQQFSTPWLDQLFRLITGLGTEYFYMLLIPVIYWSIDRRKGYRIAVLFLAAIFLNETLKEWLALPRPMPGPGLRQLAAATGPGFPSGHAMGSTALWGAVALEFPRPAVVVASLLLVLLISASRLYLGVHFLVDVLGGIVLGLAVLLVGRAVFAAGRGRRWSPRARLLVTALLVFLVLLPLCQTGTAERTLGFLLGLLVTEALGLPGAIPYHEEDSLLAHTGRLVIGLVGLFGLSLVAGLWVPPGLPSVVAFAVVALWVVLAPALFLRLGLAQVPEELRERALKRRIPGLRSVRDPRLVPMALGGTAVLAAAIAAGRLAPAGAVQAPAWLRASDHQAVVIGHRGAAELAPENTLPAFDRAVQEGATVLELDVWRSRDGHLVVLHDGRLERTTDGSGEVGELSLAELRRLDAGYHFTSDGRVFPYRGRGVRIPLLEQVLLTFRDQRFIIEIKPDDPTVADAVVEAVRRLRAERRVVLASFHQAVLQRARALAPDIPTSVAMGEALRLVVLQRLGLGVYWNPPGQVLQLPERYGWLPVVTGSLLRLAHRRQLPVHVWTINDTASMERLIAFGVDGIITDRPDRLVAVLRRQEAAGEQRLP